MAERQVFAAAAQPQRADLEPKFQPPARQISHLALLCFCESWLFMFAKMLPASYS
jgi:hypothetical protein